MVSFRGMMMWCQCAWHIYFVYTSKNSKSGTNHGSSNQWEEGAEELNMLENTGGIMKRLDPRNSKSSLEQTNKAKEKGGTTQAHEV